MNQCLLPPWPWLPSTRLKFGDFISISFGLSSPKEKFQGVKDLATENAPLTFQTKELALPEYDSAEVICVKQNLLGGFVERYW